VESLFKQPCSRHRGLHGSLNLSRIVAAQNNLTRELRNSDPIQK
jgi:hypothetical protein